MNAIGNTFNAKDFSYGHARKVWREIRNQYPSGGVIDATSATEFLPSGKIPAGTPVRFDMATKTIYVYSDAAISGAQNKSTLGINGLLQEDVYFDINDVANPAALVCTGTVVYEGEIYENMLKATTVTALKSLTTIPMIVFVQ